MHSLFSDASHLAFGGYAATLDGSVVRSMCTEDDIGRRFTYRKLKTNSYVRFSYVDKLYHKKVKIFKDNQGYC